MANGFLVVEVSTARGNIPLENVHVTIEGKNTHKRVEVRTGFDGKTSEIQLPTKPKDLSLEEQNTQIPYEEYDVTTNMNGFYDVTVLGVQIFDGQHSYLPLALIPVENTQKVVEVANTSSQIDEHNMLGQNTPRNEEGGGPSLNALFNEVIIPNTITVHLGRPEANAENVTVSFPYYIKNVASSEIFPTWPTEALKANIYAIISLALNRVYTQWYKIRGYPFQITNSTSFDQAFVKNRNIFDSISTIVDDIFNEYVRYVGNIEPLFTQYCDGKRVQCQGLKQWGSFDLANKGQSAFDILKHYYGDNIEIVASNVITDIRESYPGAPLRVGSNGKDVYLMQRYLNRISIDYPNVPSVHPQNGIFTPRMEESVKAFQRQFNLDVDGIIGKGTWYKIAYIFVSVTKLAQIGSEGFKMEEEYLKYPGKPLREGSRGIEVYALQVFVSLISQFYDSIDTPIIDSIFGRVMRNSIIQFQKEFGLTPDGIVGEDTWNHIVEVFQRLLKVIPPMDEILSYPGFPIRQGASGTNVSAIQMYLNKISQYYPSIPRISVDGQFGEATRKQVEAFQKQFGLSVDGIVGEQTWNRITDVYQAVLRISLFPGKPIAQGDRGDSVARIQQYLQAISAVYPEIPKVAVDGIFGANTTAAIKTFQKLFGLTPDGIVGKRTWNKLVEVYISDIREITTDEAFNNVYDAVFDVLRNNSQYTFNDRVGK